MPTCGMHMPFDGRLVGQLLYLENLLFSTYIHQRQWQTMVVWCEKIDYSNCCRLWKHTNQTSISPLLQCNSARIYSISMHWNCRFKTMEV